MFRVLALYFLLVNLLAYGVYWIDKRRAQRGADRVSETELLLWVLAGGTVGALLAMRKFRHKTRKRPFLLKFAAVVAVQLATLWLLLRP